MLPNLIDHRKQLEEKLIKLEAECRIIQADVLELEREHLRLKAVYKDEKQKSDSMLRLPEEQR